jgi:hypothetical protein
MLGGAPMKKVEITAYGAPEAVALARAQQGGRDGKVLVLPNGPL